MDFAKTATRPLRIAPLGDQALLTYWPTEADAQTFARQLRSAGFPWLQDVVPAYASVGIFFDIGQIRIEAVREIVEYGEFETGTGEAGQVARLHVIPCCYEMQLDMDRVSKHTGLSADEVVRLHTAAEYTVYAIGFCPGFPYLGYLPAELQNVPRLDSPRLRLEAGSVGLTGKQTGVYPLPRPGGWNILGKTPLVLVDVDDAFFPIEVGDRVKFERIDEKRYGELQGERLGG